MTTKIHNGIATITCDYCGRSWDVPANYTLSPEQEKYNDMCMHCAEVEMLAEL